MKFLSNIYNPKEPDAKRMLVLSLDETRETAWKHHLEWLQDKVIGDPQATKFYTMEQLKDMKMVGVYEQLTDETT